MKVKKSKAAPSLGECLWPFTLPGHIVMSDERGSEFGMEQVPGAGVDDGTGVSQKVFRFPRPKLNPAKKAEDISVGEDAALMWSSPNEKLLEPIENDPVELFRVAKAAAGRLAGLARHQANGKALWLFAELACEITEGLSQMTGRDRKALEPIAREMPRWPTMRSTNPHNSDPDSWLDEMKLGLNCNVCLDKFSKWEPNQATVIAIRLQVYVQDLRDKEVTIDGKPLHEILPEFTKDSYEKWWDIARGFLEVTYPEPQNIPELDRLVTGASKRRSPGRRKQAIADILKARFKAIAPAPYPT